MPSKRREKSSQINKVCKETLFNKKEVEGVWKIYNFYLKQNQTEGQHEVKFNQELFRIFLHSEFGFTDHYMMNRIFKNFDLNSDSHISVGEWAIGLSTILKGSLEELIAFCFKIYNINNDGDLEKEEVTLFLKSSFEHCSDGWEDEDPGEAIKDLVEMVFKKLDKDHNGRITLFDYKLAVTINPNLLELIGQCLPDSKSKQKFLKKLLE